MGIGDFLKGASNIGRIVGNVAGKVGDIAGKLSWIPGIGGVASTVANVANMVSKGANIATKIADAGSGIVDSFKGGGSSGGGGQGSAPKAVKVIDPNDKSSQGTLISKGGKNPQRIATGMVQTADPNKPGVSTRVINAKGGLSSARPAARG